MRIIVFEDEFVSRLHPITTGRPAYAVTCGGYRLIDWLRELETPLQGIVRPNLAGIQELDFPDLATGPNGDDESALLVNARLVPSVSVFRALQKLTKSDRTGIVRDGDDVAAVVQSNGTSAPDGQLGVANLKDHFGQADVDNLDDLSDVRLPLFQYPHDVVRHHMEIIDEGLAYRIAEGGYVEIADGVFAADGATLSEYVVTDTSQGPIVLDKDASVGSHSYLCGPALLGCNCRVKEHAAVKDRVALGHTTKIGGEIESSIVEPYTNKQHHGFLGHCYLGSWINLGAGTCNSDLKNTYGKINMEYDGERVETGMQFLGCIMGDYSKTAINTGIFTGKTIGACSMVYGFVTTNVPSFVNYARSFGQVTELPPQVMQQTQQRMFARRDVEQRPCDIRLLHDMFELTRHERQLAGDPLSL